MNYPRLCNWILLKKNTDGSFNARDCISENEYILESTIAYFVRKLDGKTDPFSILPGHPRWEVQAMLDELNEVNFLRYGRVLDSSKGSVTYCSANSLGQSRYTQIEKELMMFFYAGLLIFCNPIKYR